MCRAPRTKIDSQNSLHNKKNHVFYFANICQQVFKFFFEASGTICCELLIRQLTVIARVDAAVKA